jgi:hypothetical protein
MPLQKQYLLNPTPFARIDVHKGAFLCDSPSLVLGDDGLEVSFIGNYMGAIDAVAPPTASPILNFVTRVIKTFTQTLVSGLTGSIPINIVGGQSPYTFSSQGLPEGLSVSVNTQVVGTTQIISAAQIVGTAQVVGSYPVIVQITDATGASVVAEFIINIEPKENPAPLFKEIIDFTSTLVLDDEFNLVDVKQVASSLHETSDESSTSWIIDFTLTDSPALSWGTLTQEQWDNWMNEETWDKIY